MIRAARLALAASLLLACGCANLPAPARSPAAPGLPSSDWRDRIEAVGIGAPDPILPSAVQRKATAREAAMVRARYELVSAALNLILQSGITLATAIHLDAGLEYRLKQAVAGAETLVEFTPGDGCVARLRLSKSGLAKDLGVRFR